MSQVSRRQLAKGTAWAAPTIAIGAAAPALAASPCAGVVKGSPLPPSAFTLVYLAVTNQTFGGVADKFITVIAGIKINPTVQSCVGSASLSLASSTANSRVALTNGTSYNVSTGTEATGTGTTGVTNTGCSGGDNSAQVCITQTGMDVANSTGTSSANPTKFSLTQMISVTGFGTTAVSLNATSFTLTGSNWNGSGLSITSAPTF